MKINISKTGFSLLELIIAAALVSVVILGIFAVNNVLTGNNQDYGQRYLVKSVTQTTLNHILNNASEAIGSGTYIVNGASNFQDIGILYGQTGVGNARTFCFHQDISTTLAGGKNIDNNPPNSSPTAPPYTGALNNNPTRWLCYTWYLPTNVNYPYQIHYCTKTYDYTKAYQGAGKCTGATSTYLGTAASNPVLSINFSTTTATGFNITINNCLNNSAGSCFAQSAPVDPVNNPQVSLSGNVFPAQEGMNQS